MKITPLVVTGIALLYITGCGCGDAVRMRELHISQNTGSQAIEAFDVEFSPALLERRADTKNKCGDPTTDLRLISNQRVRVLIVPATQP